MPNMFHRDPMGRLFCSPSTFSRLYSIMGELLPGRNSSPVKFALMLKISGLGASFSA